MQLHNEPHVYACTCVSIFVQHAMSVLLYEKPVKASESRANGLLPWAAALDVCTIQGFQMCLYAWFSQIAFSKLNVLLALFRLAIYLQFLHSC